MDSQPSLHELGRIEVRQSHGLHRSRAEQIASRCAKVLRVAAARLIDAPAPQMAGPRSLATNLTDIVRRLLTLPADFGSAS